jgi:lipopolysaccharide exporter
VEEQRRVDASGRDDAAATQLTSRTLHGVKWTYMATLVSAVLQVLFAAVMARLLTPEVFGLVAMTQLVLNFGNYFAEMGIGVALVQKLKLTTLDIRAGFTSTVALGGVVSAVVWFASPLIAGIFNEPDVVPVLQFMGLSLLLTGLGSTSQSLLHREMRFREVALINVGSYAIGYFALGLTLAALGAGVWSLVWAALAQSALRSVMWYARVRHTLRPTFRVAAYKPLYGFGGRVSIISFLEYIGLNLDIFMVGRYLRTGALGQYSRGNMLVQVPLYQLMESMSQVLFPSFSQLQLDTERARRAYLSVVGLAAAFLIPMCFGMAAASREIVLVVLGDQWLPVITILPILAVNGSFLVLTHFAGVVAEATAELNRKLLLQAGYVVVLVLLLLPFHGADLWVYALLFATGSFLQHIGYMFLMRRILGVTFGDYARIYARAFAAAIGTGAVVLAGDLLLRPLGTPVTLLLAIKVALGAIMLAVMFRAGPVRPFALELLQRLDVEGDSGGLIGRATRLVAGAR